MQYNKKDNKREKPGRLARFVGGLKKVYTSIAKSMRAYYPLLLLVTLGSLRQYFAMWIVIILWFCVEGFLIFRARKAIWGQVIRPLVDLIHTSLFGKPLRKELWDKGEWEAVKRSKTKLVWKHSGRYPWQEVNETKENKENDRKV